MAEPVHGPTDEPLSRWGGWKGPKRPGRGSGPNDRRFVACSAVLGLAVAAGAVLAAGPWDSGQRKAEQDRAAASERSGGAHHQGTGATAPRPAASAPAVLAALGTAEGLKEPAGEGGLKTVLAPLLDDPALGALRTAAVVDTATGKQLYARGAATPMTPASTVKLATVAAALSALGPGHRIATTVRMSKDARTVTLVGGGDPTLDEAALRDLAAGTARAVRASGTKAVTLTYDTSRYSGPALHPISPNENIAPVSALMVDEGRLDDSDKGPAPRTGDPARDAARTFAGLLGDAGVDTRSAPSSGRAAAGTTVATHLSAPLSALVERALTNSDNDIAEALARQTALKAGMPASFAGGRRAVTERLKKLGLPVAGARLADGSGLDRADKVTAGLLTGLLALAAGPGHPELRPILTGLPVAGFSGTLGGRYTTTSRGTGLIRAKTGTLTGVNALAGTAVDAQGRLLAFAFLASGTTSPHEAEAALDASATALTRGTR
ncbi:D-alanyl-D-alanine carboxypeptidase/D-alanyl-D-alanine-endopeptidase [Streptomyces sp. B1I3]|uniref:D-alanyl-D-alanine carboxypeptidase/D-alanyl-D-alanine endopeptidase n=1 Tax=Streptomyces sp. B1I3 TaxID=3042264 RepID=UPI0027D8B1BC|nr:D-alanyl-D-alanine carboxypeptidase/D-alanyl-D-alanine-endopeptidase [Streptomyces sp. B1I3]